MHENEILNSIVHKVGFISLLPWLHETISLVFEKIDDVYLEEKKVCLEQAGELGSRASQVHMYVDWVL